MSHLCKLNVEGFVERAVKGEVFRRQFWVSNLCLERISLVEEVVDKHVDAYLWSHYSCGGGICLMIIRI